MSFLGLLWAGQALGKQPSLGPAPFVEPCPGQWVEVSAGVSADLFGVASSPYGFLAVGERGVVLASPDGAVWQTLPSPSPVDLHGVAWGEQGFLAVGEEGTAVLFKPSGQFFSWQVPRAGTLNAVTWFGGTWVVAGSRQGDFLTGFLALSQDLATWQERTPPAATPIYGLWAWEGGLVVVGWNGFFAEGEGNGAGWQATSLAGLMHQCAFMLRPSYLFGVAATVGRRVAVGLVVGDQYPGVGVALARSPEEPWQCQPTELPPAPLRLFAVVPVELVFLGGGVGGIGVSQDGLQWERAEETAGKTVRALAVTPSQWLAVGDDGLILRRSCQQPRRLRRVLRPIR